MRRDPRARLRRLVAPTCIALLALACDAPTVPGEAPGYDPTVLTGGRVYHWPLGGTIRVFVQEPDGAPQRAPLAALVRDAADAWLATLHYREHEVTLVDRIEEADVVVAYADAHPVVLDACGGFGIGAAFTLLCPDADSARTLPLRSGAAGRTKIAIALDAAQIVSDTQLAAIVAHEVGHALGVGGHSSSAADVMHTDPRVRGPSARDAATLRYVLHRPVTLRLRRAPTPGPLD